MERTIHLNELGTLLQELSYPVTRAEAMEELGEVSIQLADGETTLGETLTWVKTDRFESATELQDECFAALPVEAVGEPFQSEGEG